MYVTRKRTLWGWPFSSADLSLPLLRPEDHRGRPDPVGEEALRRHDPDRVLSERVRAHRAAALHGQPAEQMLAVAPERFSF